jgi:hypothetical protein
MTPEKGMEVPVITGLAIGIVFFITFTYVITILSDRVVTTPIVRIEQALAATEKDLEKKLPEIVAPYKLKEGEGIAEFGLLPAGPHFEPLKLVFVHQNGTQFLINQTDHTITSRCDLADQDLCYTDDRAAQDFIEGHLIYIMEVSGRLNIYVRDTSGEIVGPIEVGNRYMVDAINGKILYPPR